MIIDRIKAYPNHLLNVFKRFPLAIFFAGVSAILIIWMNSTGWASDTILSKDKCLRHWLSDFPVGAMGLAFAITLFFETRQSRKMHVLIQVLSCGLWAAISAILVNFYKFEPGYYTFESGQSYSFAISACYIFIFALPLILPFFKRSDDRALRAFAGILVKKTLLSQAISLLLSGILCGLFACFFNLFEFNDSHSTFYQNIFIFAEVFLVPLFTFCDLPKPDFKEEEFVQGTVMAVVSKYVLPIIVGLFLLLMYAQIAKAFFIYAKSGDISEYSFYALNTAILLAFIQFPKVNRIFPIASIPLLIAFVIDEIRFIPQCHHQAESLYFSVFCLWCIISIVSILTKPKRCLRWIIISFCVLGIVSSIGPQRIYNIAKIIPSKETQTETSLSESCLQEDYKTQKSSYFLDLLIQAPEESDGFIEAPQGYSKFKPVARYCTKDCSVHFSDEVTSFSIYEGYKAKIELARFEISTQSLREMEGNQSPDSPHYIIKNDSAAFVIKRFVLRKKNENDREFTFNYDGFLFIK